MTEYDKPMHFKCGCTIRFQCHLSAVPSDFFDAVFHFGGFNEFFDAQTDRDEFARVVKPGGIVLFGDESVGPWLRDTISVDRHDRTIRFSPIIAAQIAPGLCA